VRIVTQSQSFTLGGTAPNNPCVDAACAEADHDVCTDSRLLDEPGGLGPRRHAVAAPERVFLATRLLFPLRNHAF
jgi:hypothetical protein